MPGLVLRTILVTVLSHKPMDERRSKSLRGRPPFVPGISLPTAQYPRPIRVARLGLSEHSGAWMGFFLGFSAATVGLGGLPVEASRSNKRLSSPGACVACALAHAHAHTHRLVSHKKTRWWWTLLSMGHVSDCRTGSQSPFELANSRFVDWSGNA